MKDLPRRRGDAAEADRRWMRRAIAHARRGLGRTTPNPAVGACVVSDEGIVLGDGFHERAGGSHAEVHAIEAAGTAARGATLYCTLEPCAHTGRTGPCTDRIIAAGIRRVVVAMEDPNPLVRGRGFAMLREHHVQVDVGVEHEAARRLNLPFLTAVTHGRPHVVLKAAVSLDWCVAGAPGERTSITSSAALRHAQAVRARIDAIGVGTGTLLIDDPWLTAREVYRERPLVRVVFDRRLRTPPSARLLSTLAAGPVIIMTSPAAHAAAPHRVAAIERRGGVVEPVADLRAILHLLGARGVQSLLIEGGPTLEAAFWDAGLVDSVQLYVAPTSLGPAGVPLLPGRPFIAAALHEQRVTQMGPDVLIEGYVHRPD